MAVSRRLRYEILRRDNHTCRYCGASAPDVKLTVDHVVPVSLGGVDEPGNLVTACQPCNAGKTSSSPDAPLVSNVRADAIRWAAAMRAAALEQAEHQEEVAWFCDEVDVVWHTWHYGADEKAIPRPYNWRGTIEQFHNAGLEIDVILDKARYALGNDSVTVSNTWRYFCGCCWRVVRERQERAAEILAEDPPGSEVPW